MYETQKQWSTSFCVEKIDGIELRLSGLRFRSPIASTVEPAISSGAQLGYVHKQCFATRLRVKSEPIDHGGSASQLERLHARGSKIVSQLENATRLRQQTGGVGWRVEGGG